MADFEDLVRTIVTMLDPDEQDRLREMEDWIIKNEGTWVLAEGFNSFLGKVLHDKAIPSDARVAMLRLLAYGAAQVRSGLFLIRGWGLSLGFIRYNGGLSLPENVVLKSLFGMP